MIAKIVFFFIPALFIFILHLVIFVQVSGLLFESLSLTGQILHLLGENKLLISLVFILFIKVKLYIFIILLLLFINLYVKILFFFFDISYCMFFLLSLYSGPTIFTVPLLYCIEFFLSFVSQVRSTLRMQPATIRTFLVSIAFHKEF